MRFVARRLHQRTHQCGYRCGITHSPWLRGLTKYEANHGSCNAHISSLKRRTAECHPQLSTLSGYLWLIVFLRSRNFYSNVSYWPLCEKLTILKMHAFYGFLRHAVSPQTRRIKFKQTKGNTFLLGLNLDPNCERANRSPKHIKNASKGMTQFNTIHLNINS